MQTPDGNKLNLDALYKICPSCFTEAADEKGTLRRVVDWTKLRALLGGDAVEDAPEAYDFTWVGKRAAQREAAAPINKTLRPCPEESVDWDHTQNLYIEGDNLEVLKLLQNSYMGKVKMIYIDPPYNTGNDFVYHDDFAVSADEYDEHNIDEEGNRFRKNTDSNGRFHSDWCSMMYSRLMVARTMLKDDGVIFVSIDDNEVRNLRNICDEVFGEQNFLSNLIWEKKYTIANDAQYFSSVHDHILCYTKCKEHFKIGKLPRTDEMNAAYKNPDNHPKGPWKATPLHARSGKDSNFSYTFKNGVVFTPPSGRFSAYSKETLQKFDEGGEIWFGADGKSTPSRKTFLCDLKNEGVVPRTIIPFSQGGHNHEADEEVKHLLGKKVFTSPKPTRLIKHLIVIANLSEGDIVLDFFSGSATTADALMQYNSENKKSNKFILVQLDEYCEENSEAYREGYQTIPKIAEERIRRAGGNIKENNPDLDTGFRVFKCDSSNMKDVYFAPKDYSQSMLLDLEDNIKEDRTDLDLLFDCMLRWGVELSLPLSLQRVDGCTIHNVNEGDLVACFDGTISDKVIDAIADLHPLRVVFRDSSFSEAAQKMNLFELFKQKCNWSETEVKNNVRVI